VSLPACPTCNKAVEDPNNPFRPFCSERCKLVDLGRWLGEQYRVPTKEKPPDTNHMRNAEDDD
jgi:endogenous inhibitor of DNA gyrase (YacG/DUF329 family)